MKKQKKKSFQKFGPIKYEISFFFPYMDILLRSSYYVWWSWLKNRYIYPNHIELNKYWTYEGIEHNELKKTKLTRTFKKFIHY
jgi:hypothetical protein